MNATLKSTCALALMLAAAWQPVARAAEPLPPSLAGTWSTGQDPFAGGTRQVDLHLQANGQGLLIGSNSHYPGVFLSTPLSSTLDGGSLAVQLDGQLKLTCRYNAALLACQDAQGVTLMLHRRGAAIPENLREGSDSMCRPYGASALPLLGSLRLDTVFGPPNYGESPATDAQEVQGVLDLAVPLCTLAGDGTAAELHQQHITLAPLPGLDLSAYVGKFIAVKGELFHAFSGHHHTPVLMTVREAPVLLSPLP